MSTRTKDIPPDLETLSMIVCESVKCLIHAMNMMNNSLFDHQGARSQVVDKWSNGPALQGVCGGGLCVCVYGRRQEGVMVELYSVS